MNALVDSNIFIAAWHKHDQHKPQATEILRRFGEGDPQFLYTTNYVLLEVVNFLLRKTDFNNALEAYDYITRSDRIKIVYIDRVMESQLKNLFLKYECALTDCSLIMLSEMLHVKTMFSFDSGFDRVKNITRHDTIPKVF